MFATGSYSLTTLLIVLVNMLVWVVQPSPRVICIPSIVNSLFRVFTHYRLWHLAFNMSAFLNLAPMLELRPNYGMLLVAAIALTSLGDWFMSQHGGYVCSIGFSGVIFALITHWYLTSYAKATEVARSLALLLLPSLFIPRISLSGHLIGVVAGFIITGLMK